MAKVIDITEQLDFEDNPCIEIKGKKYEVNADAPNVLKVLQSLGDGDNISPESIAELCDLIFTEKSKKDLEKLKLKFKDYQKVIKCAIDLITDEDGEDEGE